LTEAAEHESIERKERDLTPTHMNKHEVIKHDRVEVFAVPEIQVASGGVPLPVLLILGLCAV
jgi:hypothetical protein